MYIYIFISLYIYTCNAARHSYNALITFKFCCCCCSLLLILSLWLLMLLVLDVSFLFAHLAPSLKVVLFELVDCIQIELILFAFHVRFNFMNLWITHRPNTKKWRRLFEWLRSIDRDSKRTFHQFQYTFIYICFYIDPILLAHRLVGLDTLPLSIRIIPLITIHITILEPLLL